MCGPGDARPKRVEKRATCKIIKRMKGFMCKGIPEIKIFL